MTKTIEAVYERGVLRPLEPLQLPEGARLDIILVTDDEAGARMTPADILYEEHTKKWIFTLTMHRAFHCSNHTRTSPES